MSQNLKFKLIGAVQNWRIRYFPSGDTVEDQAQWIKSWIVAVIALASCAGLYLAIPSSSADTELVQAEESLQQLIPPGHVVVPIEPVNAEALDSVLDSHGLVDLFSSGQKSQGQILFSRVILVRAPKNPRQFAVVLDESRMASPQLIALTEPLYVVVRSQKDNLNAQSISSRQVESPGAEGATTLALSQIRRRERTGRLAHVALREPRVVVVSEQVESMNHDEEEKP